jgi:hypothetical protein
MTGADTPGELLAELGLSCEQALLVSGPRRGMLRAINGWSRWFFDCLRDE